MDFMILTQSEIRQCMDMKQAILIMESAFKQYHAHQTILPLRTPISIEKEKGLC